MSQSVLAWVASFDRFDGRTGIKPGLQRMEAMLERLGNPHQKLKFLHVAGTNGKGSTCAYLAHILEAAGYRVGLYTSPHLESFNDRMTVSGRSIRDDELESLVARLQPVVEEIEATECGRPTEFEVVCTLSILYYVEQQADYVVWETGLGGRLDSTNVVTPLVSLITNVGFDHEAILGPTLEKIAAEKAGIIKPGVPVLTTADGIPRDVIVRTAEEKGSPALLFGCDFSAAQTDSSLEGQHFDWNGLGESLPGLFVQMLGEHQVANAGLAVAACVQLRAQGVAISEQAIRDGLARTRWAGRLEIIQREPLLLLDGAHNPQGAAALGQAMRELLPDRRIVLIIGIMADKAIPEVLAEVVPLASQIVVTHADLPRSADVNEVAALIHMIAPQLAVETTSTVQEGLHRAKQLAKHPDDAIVCMGSLYMISEARKLLLHQGNRRY